jgi:hypothetical protein
MARNGKNVPVWEDAHVYVSDTKELPASGDAEWPESWSEVGVLDGNEGFDEQRNWNTQDEHGWGVGYILTLYSQFKLTKSFTPLEGNPVVDELFEPGSTATDVVIPKPAEKYIGFETIDRNGVVHRRISRKKADIWAPGSKQAENALTRKSFVATIPADGLKRLWHKQTSTASEINGVQTVTLPAGTTAGTFILTYGAAPTTALQYNATPATVRSALEAITAIGAGNVKVTGTPLTGLTIDFINDLEGEPVLKLTATGTLTPAGTVTVEVADEED